MEKKIANQPLLGQTFWLIVKMLFILVIFAHPVYAKQNISLDVQYKQGEDGVSMLKMILKNEGREDFSISEAALPWGYRYNLALFAGRIMTPEPLLTEIVTEGMVDGKTHVLKPGESLTGEIIIHHRLTGFDSVVRIYDVAILWVYEVKSSVFERTGDYIHGSLIVRKH